jgi:TonB family protein
MRTTSELLLAFLLNACWLIALIAAVAALGDWCLGRTVVRFRHLLWVAALAMSFLLPLFASLTSFHRSALPGSQRQEIVVEPLPITDVPQPAASSVSGAKSAVHINERIAVSLLALYLSFVIYRSVKLFHAWAKTLTAKRAAHPLEFADDIRAIVTTCQKAIGVRVVSVLSSASLSIPATIGIFRSLVILPESLLRDAERDALTAAIGHELVHVLRRDYLLNLIYEIVFLPLSFHPAAVLMKRRITQTRELRCDELVAERLLQPEVYARTLVQLAGSAMPFNRRGQTIAVGIADADILEVRIMSLLKRTKLNAGRRKFWMAAAALLLAIPCVAAASFAFHFNIDAASGTLSAQEPSSAAPEKREARIREERDLKERAEREDRELKERIEKETNPEIKAKLEAVLRRRQEERSNAAVTMGFSFQGQEYEVTLGQEAERRAEREIEAKRKAELARLARITMDQAIQIATSQQPGKVLECSLIGEHWEEPGKLAKDGLVLYHVVIFSGDEANPSTTHVLVNALDGTISKISKEERKNETSPNLSGERPPIEGGVLNGKAISLPLPAYPAIARAAHASGAVTVEVTIDEEGNVIAARAVSGHPLLQASSVSAAREAKFAPTRLNGEPVKVTGVIIYNFVAQ